MNEIKLNTLLGNFWEQVVSDVLDELSVPCDRSPDLGIGIINPDFVCQKHKTTIFVTSTGSSQSFIKKRWRYINELFQTKGVLGKNMVIANLVLTTDFNLQNIERTIFHKLFDFVAFGDEFPSYNTIYQWARSELAVEVEVNELSTRFKGNTKAKKFRVAIKKWLRKTLSAKPTKLSGLWTAVENYQTNRIRQPIYPNEPTYLRRVCLKLLPLDSTERKAVLKGLSGNPIVVDADRLAKVGISFKKILGGRLRIDDNELLTTFAGGFSLEQIQKIILSLEADNESIKFPLDEVIDIDSVERAYAHCKPAFASSGDLSAAALREFNNPQVSRLKIWDYAVALADTSVLDVNKEYVKRWGKIVVANPINNVILKTEIGYSIAKNVEISEVIARASTILWERLPARITRSLFTEKVMDYRRRSLFLQPYLNPVQRRFEEVCSNILGITVELRKNDCLLSDVGIGGRARRVEAIYTFKIKNKSWLFKVLSGYKGGYEHKADEMAARAWLLRFRIEAHSGKPFVDPLNLVFVYEGEWDEKYLSLLHASGWDYIVHLSKIESFLKKVSR